MPVFTTREGVQFCLARETNNRFYLLRREKIPCNHPDCRDSGKCPEYRTVDEVEPAYDLRVGDRRAIQLNHQPELTDFSKFYGLESHLFPCPPGHYEFDLVTVTRKGQSATLAILPGTTIGVDAATLVKWQSAPEN